MASKKAPMRELTLGAAVDRAIEDAMARDDSIVLIGEDAPMLRAPLFARFGADRVLAAPISESAFFGAAAGAAMAGLRSRGVVFEEVDFGEFGSTVDGVISMPGGNDKAAWFKDSEGNILSLSTIG